MANTNSATVQRYIDGIDYPQDKEAIIKKARDKGADEETISALSALPDREYDSSTDVSSELSMDTSGEGESDAMDEEGV